MRFLYNVSMYILGYALKLAALKNNKARLWVAGRKDWEERLAAAVKGWDGMKVAWFHCASYGEFEQGRPLIEAFKKRAADCKIVLSFYSPSGYEAFKNWGGADLITYLPLDTARNAKRFVALVQPSVVFFIKYEFWLNILFRLKEKNIPLYLVAAVFKPRHAFFRWYGGLYRQCLNCFSKLFLQDEGSGDLLKSIGFTNFLVSGDTRFDRVIDLKKNFQPLTDLALFKGTHQLIVAGSTWKKDAALVVGTFAKMNHEGLKLVIAPHQIEGDFINEIVVLLKAYDLSFCCYSDGVVESAQVLIIDTMGMLSQIYHYADLSYIGGGFNGGIHNVLEPAVYGCGITFYGSSYCDFVEAETLVKRGCAFSVSSLFDLEMIWKRLLFDAAFQKGIQDKLNFYFNENTRVAERILDEVDFRVLGV